MRSSKLLGAPVLSWILFFAFADVMLALPRLDLWVSGVFYTPGAGFLLRDQPFERLVYWSVNVTTTAIVLLLGLLWWRKRLPGRKLAFLMSVLILIPGLLVNQAFKEHWGRARPVNLVDFGGGKSFSPPFVPSDQGGGSFSSGHAAAAAYLAVAAATLAGCRSWWLRLAVVYALVVGLVRIAAGGHFMSDVLTSFFLVWIGALVLFRLFYGRDAACVSEPG